MLTNVTYGVASKYGYALTILTALAAAVTELAGQATALGIPTSTLAWISAGLAIITTLGRWAQKLWGERPIGMGLPSWAAFTVNAIAGLMLILGDLVNQAITLGVSQRVWGIMIAALSAALILARQLSSALGDNNTGAPQ